MIDSSLKVKMYGEYKLVIKKPSGEVYETEWMKNVITDIGLDRLAVNSSTVNYCRIGTGISPPNVTNTQLDNQSGVSASSGTNSESRSGNNVTSTWTYSFAQGALVGNMTEIGVGWATTGATLFSRALILDGSGNPTAITLTSIDQLTAYYRCTMVPPTGDITGSFVISGVTYNYLGRPANIGSWITAGGSSQDIPSPGIAILFANSTRFGGTSSTIGSITGIPNNTVGLASPSVSYSTYTPGSKYVDATLSVSASTGNPVGGIKTIELVTANYCYFQYEITPLIPKDNTKTFSMTFRLSWDRA